MFCILLATLYFSFVNSELQEYCSTPLNKSDCGLAPTPVFSYYKPGSMCKIETWKGCPTKNMFDSEHKCSSLCFGNIAVVDEENRCDVPLNTNACKKKTAEVFTFDKEKQTCVEALWHGCPSLNKFNDKLSCVEACHNQNNKQEWMDKLKSLDISSIRRMYKVLEEIIKTNATDKENNTHNEMVKNKETASQTTDERDNVKEMKDEAKSSDADTILVKST